MYGPRSGDVTALPASHTTMTRPSCLRSPPRDARRACVDSPVTECPCTKDGTRSRRVDSTRHLRDTAVDGSKGQPLRGAEPRAHDHRGADLAALLLVGFQITIQETAASLSPTTAFRRAASRRGSWLTLPRTGCQLKDRTCSQFFLASHMADGVGQSRIGRRKHYR